MLQLWQWYFPWQPYFRATFVSFLVFFLNSSDTKLLESSSLRRFGIIWGKAEQCTLTANCSWWENQFRFAFLWVTHLRQAGFWFLCVSVQKSTSFAHSQYPLNHSTNTTDLERENDPLKCKYNTDDELDDLFGHSSASEQWVKVGVKLKQEARAVVLPAGVNPTITVIYLHKYS